MLSLRVPRRGPWLALGLLALTLTGADRPDLVVADFEGDDYGGWTATGEAFGKSPARGTLPGQMDVSGFQGRGLVNSFRGGDGATGTLTSPPFRLERRHLNFLIGGGKDSKNLTLDLLVDGQVARTATGPNDRGGGSERLDWESWDVSELAGREAVLRVTDHAKGGWGHINVDQIVQSDTSRGLSDAVRELQAEKRYLHLPVQNDAPIRKVKVAAGGKVVDEFDIKLAQSRTDFVVFLDLEPHRGKPVRIESRLPGGATALAGLRLDDAIPDAGRTYHEPGRPQFHFTSRRGWLNDPNGLVWFAGEYHLYYQHNPYGWDWGNMHWGHAVSPDLFHWTELPTAIYPKAHGDWAFSGSAVVDERNTSGFGAGNAPPLVGAYTSTGRGECIVYSRDRGRTWTEYEKNPVVKHEGRDPRLVWHAPSGRWVMAVYDETGGRRSIAFHTSPDLKTWTYASKIDGFFECPELFEMPVTEREGESRWVLYAADGEYMLGRFDGREFRPDGPKHRVWHGQFYASQTFSNSPGGRRVQIGWANGVTFPGEPFNQQMNVPCELTLRATADGPRLFVNPVAELNGLRSRSQQVRPRTLHPGKDALADSPVTAALFDAEIELDLGAKGKLVINAGGTPFTVDAAGKTLDCDGLKVPLSTDRGVVRVRLLVDRGSVEAFVNDGQVAVSRVRQRRGETGLTLTAGDAGPVQLRKLDIHELRSAWPAAATR